MKRAFRAAVAAIVVAGAMGVSAQQEPAQPERAPLLPPGTKTGNPTPGTPQPDPPNLANRITLVGCVQLTDPKAAGKSDPNTPSDARFVLARAERKTIVPPGTGTSSAVASVASDSYRLRAIDSQLSPFVGAKVEVSGEMVPDATAEPGSSPVVQVEFVQKMSTTCP